MTRDPAAGARGCTELSPRARRLSRHRCRARAPRHQSSGQLRVLCGRGSDVSGILNGIDTRICIWDPAADSALPARSDASQPTGKAQCKAALRGRFGHELQPQAPLLCMVSRLASQNGLDLVLAALPDPMRTGALRLAVQITGDPTLEAASGRP